MIATETKISFKKSGFIKSIKGEKTRVFKGQLEKVIDFDVKERRATVQEMEKLPGGIINVPKCYSFSIVGEYDTVTYKNVDADLISVIE